MVVVKRFVLMLEMLFLFTTCFGSKLSAVVDRIRGLENSLYKYRDVLDQDIRLLRGSLEQNTDTIEYLTLLVNETLSHVRSNIGKSTSAEAMDSNSNTDLNDNVKKTGDINELKSEIERVKRAFVDEKIYRREVQTEQSGKLDSVVQLLNTLNETINEKLVDLKKEISLENAVTLLIVMNSINTSKGEIMAETAFLKSQLTLDDTENKTIGQAVASMVQDEDSDFDIRMVCNALSISRGNCTTGKCCMRAVLDKFITVPGTINGASMRLVNVSRTIDGGIGGRLEVNYNSKWGTVCDDDFTRLNAKVVCQALGFSSGFYKKSAYFGQGTGDIFLDDVKCTGSETTIFNCPNRGSVGDHNCGHGEDVGVICSQ